MREQLWQSGAELQQQADFCSGLGSAACSLLWSCSAREDTVTQWLADVSYHPEVCVCACVCYTHPSDNQGELYTLHVCVQGKLQSFLAVAAQTLESFVGSLDEEVKTQTEDHDSQEHQFVLALAGTITSEFTLLTCNCIHTHLKILLLHHVCVVLYTVLHLSFPDLS